MRVRTLVGLGMAGVMVLSAGGAGAAQLRVMKTGLGSGIVASGPAGITCGADCDETYASGTFVSLAAAPDPGSVFVRWEGDAVGTANPITVVMSADRSVRAVFDLATAIPILADFTPGGIQTYLTANPIVTTPARFLKALPTEFKQNWVLMSRSESLQTGIAESPRLLLPSRDARAVFTIGMIQHSSYPGSHPNAVEYMQWDAAEKNFRFHEIVLANIGDMGDLITFPDGTTTRTIPARTRGVGVDDAKCFKCHSTRNVLNRSTFPGTTGIPPGTVKWKNKPNWDTYDSWGGLMPFNRDRIYQGSVEAAAFRKLFNLWTWRANDPVRGIIEQLDLQPPGVPAAHIISRTVGGANDGHIDFAFDISPPVLVEPAPSGSGSITTAYSFDGLAGIGAGTAVTTGGSFVTLHHSDTPMDDEGRGVQLFDFLGGGDGNLNQQRIADELINHRFATGSFPIDVRPVALAIAQGWIAVSGSSVASTVSGTPLAVDLTFFNARQALPAPVITTLVSDTRTREQSMPRRKADIEKRNLDRSVDPYLSTASGPVNGLVQQYGAATSFGVDTSMPRLRKEVFRRSTSGFVGDSTVMGGIYVDREQYSQNTEKLALFRYFLEPLGVSVDKWAMGVRGRSRNYAFADVFGGYLSQLGSDLRSSLLSNPIPGLSDPNNASQVINAVNSTLSLLPAANDVPTFTDVQRILNKSCIECHGGLLYPPYRNHVNFTPSGHAFGPDDHLNFSEDENPPAAAGTFRRLARSYGHAVALTTAGNPATSYLYNRITATTEDCPYGLMPCGGPALSSVDIDTIRRWIMGPPARPSSMGDPHLKTVDGVNYDFQGVGEFVLLRDEGLEIQARQTAVATDGPLGPNPYTGLTSCVSVNTAVAIRMGTDRITYEPNINGRPDPTGLHLRINGELTQMTARGVPLSYGGRVIQTTAPGGIQVETPGGTVIVITPGWWDYYQVWWLGVDVRNVRATMGLMGSIARGNWLPALPDGTRLGPRPASLQQRYTDLYEKFGKAWRVTDTTSLFDYAPGTSTDTFTIPSWPNGISNQFCVPPPQPGVSNRPPQKPLSLAEAERACSGVVDPDRRANCIQDVMVTGEIGFAKTYLLADQIDRNAIPTPPALVFPPALLSNVVIKPVTFTWNRATDQDGDPISYKLYVWSAGQIPNNNDAQPVLAPDKLSIKLRDGRVVLEWVGAGAQLQSAATVVGPWRSISNAVSPHLVVPNAKSQFYKLALNPVITTTLSDVESGKAYLWKVIAEDGKGGTVESETRRFEVK